MNSLLTPSDPVPISVLEVIVCSVVDAVAAQQGGASRLELVSHLEVGGLTPPADLVREVVAAVRLPVRVMLRETESFAVTRESERRRICLVGAELSRLGVDGLVCGFIKGGGLDYDLLGNLFASARDTRVTFHRAFESLDNPLASIDELKKFGCVDRILTSGGARDKEQTVDYFRRCAHAAGPELVIMAGGGLDESRIRMLRSTTPVREFHVGRSVRVGATAGGPVDAALVRQVALCVVAG